LVFMFFCAIFVTFCKNCISWEEISFCKGQVEILAFFILVQ